MRENLPNSDYFLADKITFWLSTIMRFNLLFQSKLKLKWEQLADMPEPMMCPRSVIVDGAVYVTAGNGGHYIHILQRIIKEHKSLRSVNDTCLLLTR